MKQLSTNQEQELAEVIANFIVKNNPSLEGKEDTVEQSLFEYGLFEAVSMAIDYLGESYE